MNPPISSLSYCGPPPLPEELWGRWNFDPVLLAAMVLAPDAFWAAGLAVPGFLLVLAAMLRVLTAEERIALKPLLRRPWQARRLLQSGAT